MPSEDKRKQDQSGPGTHKRLRNNEQNNNTVDDPSPDFSVDITDEGISKCGVLKWVTVKNFMCHDHLKFEFSPHINFVQGRNGSGKSAILTAVVIGLGGMARWTNRGNNLRDLIKHGKHIAVIEIGINNSGCNAFKPESYGNTIIVERRISLSAATSYKVKACDGKVVSVKKDELSRMLEHFNLQVDNPVTILNQDMSRSFFNTTEPKMLFKLFLKATQLQQMKDDYADLERNIESSLRTIECRKECLPDLEKEVEEQRIHYQFSLSLREKGNRLKELRHELAWAKIINLEQEKAKAEKDLENHTKARKEIQEKIEELQKVLEQETEVRERNTKLLEEATSHLTTVSKEVREVDRKMRKIRNELKEKQSQFNTTEKKVRTLASEISTLRSAIEKDNDGAKSRWAAVRAEWQRKMNIVEDEIKELMENLKTENTHFDNLQHTLDLKKSEKTHLDLEEKALSKQLNGLERELKGLQGQKGSHLTVYGQWVPQLLEKILHAHSNGLFIKKPVGPMGAFIKVRDTKWAHVAERVLGKRITSFCVDNQKDEKVLRELMKSITFDQQSMPIVSVSKFRDKVLDVSRFETSSSKYSSLWSILDISDTVVANTVIDQMQVESILLIPTAQEAGRLLKDRSKVPRNCKCAYTLNLDQYYPDPNYRVYSGRGSHRARFLQVSVEDKIKDIMKNKEECKERLMLLLAHEIKESQVEIKSLQEKIGMSNKKTQAYKRKLETLRMKVADLQNEEAPAPPDIAQLEEDVRQQEINMENVKAKMEEIRKSSLEKKQEFSNFSGALLELRQKEKHAYKEVEKCKRALEEACANAAILEIQSCKKKDKDLKMKKKHLEKSLTSATETLEKAMKSADAFNLGARIETKKSVKELERQYTSLQARLDKERATSGDPITIAERYVATKQRYKQVSEDLNKHISLMKKLQESLQMREANCMRLHKWLAVIVKYFFKEHLSVRKLDGSISINIQEQTLNIHVEKPNVCHTSPVKNQVTPKQLKKSKGHQDLVMMSGGERSFATVAFIIALWHAIVSPVRILDEFDVFMDVIARNHAMKMMISAAKQDTQYIFLTPLNLDTSKLRNCQFFRMPDHTDQSQDG
ncbi:hypothetical protein O3P69_009077 [Scylla paramamosain]|uniref:RecF/RecN/SMC N-terminal domain-containing protein n=4 Tax=Scylla paramamosain TaxID=85552 RepID=A0AAW0TQP2_SCYPA